LVPSAVAHVLVRMIKVGDVDHRHRFGLPGRRLGLITVERGVAIRGPGNMASDDHRHGGENLQQLVHG